MKLKTIIIFFFCSILIANNNYCDSDLLTKKISSRQYYNIGDTISDEDQNFSYDVCHGDGNYDTGSSFKFSDYSGNIILISINATW